MAEIDLAGLLKRFTDEYGEARTARQGQFESGMSDLSSVIETYQPGGGSTAGLLQTGMAPIEQQMVSRGLSGTTRPGAVRAGMAADIESQRLAGEAGAKTSQAGYGAGFEDIAPTAGTISHLATGGFSGLLSRDIAEAAARPDYQSRVDYGVPSIAPAPTGGVSSSGGGTGSKVSTGPGIDSGYENKLYGGLGGGGGAGNIPEGYEFTPDDLGGGTWTPPEPTAQPGDTYTYGSREDVAAKIARGSTTV